ncbi:hypothetical protein AB0P17_14470 [Streptomyces sp. NPDC088124]|uniref:hypothetical protein n=1 Tax=Streptomyces sp. NPDC088124 TaxID=3154654 RepID=UPI00344AEF4C
MTEEFSKIMEEIVADTAPRLFAVFHEVGQEDDCWVAAWGLAFDDRAEAVTPPGALRVTASSPEQTARHFPRSKGLTAHLVWVASVN